MASADGQVRGEEILRARHDRAFDYTYEGRRVDEKSSLEAAATSTSVQGLRRSFFFF